MKGIDERIEAIRRDVMLMHEQTGTIHGYA